MMRLLFFLVALVPLNVFSQSAEDYFHTSAKLYIGEKTKEAKQTVQEGIRKYPGDKDLRELDGKIKEEEKKKDEEKKKQEKEEKEKKEKEEQEKKEKQEKEKQENKDKKDKQDKENEEKKDQEKKDQEQKDEQKENKDPKDKKDIPPSVSEKLKDMKMNEDQARKVLEAMKQQEVQYLQQNKRKATKPKSKGKPDW